MSYQLRDHTADVAVEARGESLEELFGAVADGLAEACMSLEELPDTGDRFEITVAAEDLDSVLYDYLDELIYQRDIRSELPVDNVVELEQLDGEWQVTGSARGVPVQGLGAREVKAVTYSEMQLERRDESWYAYVVFDV